MSDSYGYWLILKAELSASYKNEYIVFGRPYLKVTLWYSIDDFLHTLQLILVHSISISFRMVFFWLLIRCCTKLHFSPQHMQKSRSSSGIFDVPPPDATHCRHSSPDIISLRRKRGEEVVVSICSRFASWNLSIFSHLNRGICDGRSSWYLKVQGGLTCTETQRDSVSDTVTGSDSSPILIHHVGQIHPEGIIVLCWVFFLLPTASL